MGVYRGTYDPRREPPPPPAAPPPPEEEWIGVGDSWAYHIENGRYTIQSDACGLEWAWRPANSAHRWGGVVLRFDLADAVAACKLACEEHREGKLKARKLE